MSNIPFKTCAQDGEAELIERKSRFIGYISHVSTEADAKSYIDTVRFLHPEANHHVWCYILNRGAVVKASDDGEPSGTAGRPISEVLLREDLSDVACVVVRYFGGILLGAGGLIRAYASSAKLALDVSEIVEMVPMEKIRVTIPYHYYGKINSYLQKADIILQDPLFSEDVSFQIVIAPDQLSCLSSVLMDMTAGKTAIQHLDTILMPKK